MLNASLTDWVSRCHAGSEELLEWTELAHVPAESLDGEGSLDATERQKVEFHFDLIRRLPRLRSGRAGRRQTGSPGAAVQWRPRQKNRKSFQQLGEQRLGWRSLGSTSA